MNQTISEIIEGRQKEQSHDLIAKTDSYLDEAKVPNAELLKFDIRKKN
jgi:hypothetical protein